MKAVLFPRGGRSQRQRGIGQTARGTMGRKPVKLIALLRPLQEQ